MERSYEILFYRIIGMISTRLLVWVEQIGEPKLVEEREESEELVEPGTQQASSDAPGKAPVVPESLLKRPRAKATKLVIDRKPEPEADPRPELELAIDNGECACGELRVRTHYELPDGWKIVSRKAS